MPTPGIQEHLHSIEQMLGDAFDCLERGEPLLLEPLQQEITETCAMVGLIPDHEKSRHAAHLQRIMRRLDSLTERLLEQKAALQLQITTSMTGKQAVRAYLNAKKE